MSIPGVYVILALVAVFVASFLVTRMTIFLAVRQGLMDVPNARSSHETPTPRGGGLAIVMVFLLAVSIFYVQGSIKDLYFNSLVWGGMLIALIGLIDDFSHISPLLRLFVHGLAVSIFLIFQPQLSTIEIENFSVPSGIVYLVCAFVLVWLVNLYNFMDGIDGIAAIETITVLGGFGILMLSNPPEQMLATPESVSQMYLLILFLIFAVLGFLFWNWPPARVFMGDSGSGSLGFFVGAVTFLCISLKILTFWACSILLAIFIVDATYTLLRRMLAGRKWYAAHRSHAYQRAALATGSHTRVTLAVLLINILWLLPLAWLAQRFQGVGYSFAIIAYMSILAVVIYWKAGTESGAQ